MIKKFFLGVFALAIAAATVFAFTAGPVEAGYKSSSVRNIGRSFKAPSFKATPAKPAVKFTAPVRKVEPPAKTRTQATPTRTQTRTVYRDRTVYQNTNGGGGVMDSLIGTMGGMWLYDSLTGDNDQPAQAPAQTVTQSTTLPERSVSTPSTVQTSPEPENGSGGSLWPWLFGLLGLAGVGWLGLNYIGAPRQ